VRINPLDGEGAKDANVTDMRHSLIEADDQDLGKQLALIRRLNLPCSAIVHSGGKSIHALVRVSAATPEEYRERVDRLYAVCKASGLKVDGANRNPSRLSRLPGVERDGRPQYLISGPCGAPSWAAWEAESKADTDPLPEARSIMDYATPQPGDPGELLKNRFLCRGGALLFVGPTGVGKSACLVQAAFLWALGQPFFGIAPARPWSGLRRACKKPLPCAIPKPQSDGLRSCLRRGRTLQNLLAMRSIAASRGKKGRISFGGFFQIRQSVDGQLQPFRKGLRRLRKVVVTAAL
jgi:hypothetical protein